VGYEMLSLVGYSATARLDTAASHCTEKVTSNLSAFADSIYRCSFLAVILGCSDDREAAQLFSRHNLERVIGWGRAAATRCMPAPHQRKVLDGARSAIARVCCKHGLFGWLANQANKDESSESRAKRHASVFSLSICFLDYRFTKFAARATTRGRLAVSEVGAIDVSWRSAITANSDAGDAILILEGRADNGKFSEARADWSKIADSHVYLSER
jgi:hypothetical protein